MFDVSYSSFSGWVLQLHSSKSKTIIFCASQVLERERICLEDVRWVDLVFEYGELQGSEVVLL